MIILELAKEVGLNPIRTASTNGGEYKSSCPKCGGDNRFCIWPNESSTGRYWCRQCDKAGDAIQFCCDYMGMNFRDACIKVKHFPALSGLKKKSFREEFSPKEMVIPSELWRKQGMVFLQKSHNYLLQNSHLLNLEKDRGLTLQSIIDYKLGWNSSDVFEKKNAWGIAPKKEESQWLCMPKGIVIPSFRDEELVRIKIRRHEWHRETKYPKYQIVSGSLTAPMLFGDADKPLIIIESELDAILIQQKAKDLCGVVALGGVGMKPDTAIDNILRSTPAILCALDFDEAGKKAYFFWRSTYQQLRSWPVPRGKSPGDAYDLGVDLRNWIEVGIEHIQKIV